MRVLEAYMDWITDGSIWRVIVGVMGPVILLTALLWFFVIVPDYERYVAWCESQGGHVIEDTDTGVGPAIGSNGGVAVTVSTDYYCLSDDGGIIDIR